MRKHGRGGRLHESLINRVLSENNKKYILYFPKIKTENLKYFPEKFGLKILIAINILG